MHFLGVLSFFTTGLLIVVSILLLRCKRELKELKTNNDRFEKTLDAAQIGTFDMDYKSGKIRWSKYHEFLWGYEEGEFDGTSQAFRMRLHPEDRDRVISELSAAKEHGGEYECITRVLLPNGRINWVKGLGRVYLDEIGKPFRAVGTVFEINGSKVLEASLREALGQAESANRAKSAFLANISHEIRTPLTAILGFAELLCDEEVERDFDNPTTHLCLIQRILDNGKHLLSLIDDILDISKIEAEKFSFCCSNFSVRRLAESVREIFFSRGVDSGVPIFFHIDENVPETISTDPLRLKQIIINLLGNAVKFTVSGQINLTLRLSNDFDQAQGGMLEIICVDTGIGISEENQIRLFQLFSQADEGLSRRKGGVGLGLYLSRQLAVGLGGNLQLASSAVGKGSTFIATVALPPAMVEQRNSHESGFLPGTVCEGMLQSRIDGLNILLVEDSLDLRELITALLKKLGAMRIDTAKDGVEGLRMAQQYKYDLLMIDVQMPKMDGHEVARRLRRSNYPGALVAVSAYAMASDAAASIASGFDQHLAKPVDRSRLVRAIQAALIAAKHRAPGQDNSRTCQTVES